MANHDHLEKIKKGVDIWNKWRRENPMIVADLRNANLDHMDFRDIQLSVVDLSGASLRGGDFGRSVLYMADLSNANFSGSIFGFTKFLNVDLSKAKGLENAMHAGPSTIGIDTIFRSKGNIPETFLQNAGIPPHSIKLICMLAGNVYGFKSCFISYSQQDKIFVEKLYSDLQKNGVPCWYAPKDIKIGDKIRQTIEEAILQHDKLLLVLSAHSINSAWVEKEVETVFDKEKNGETVLFPICIDSQVMNTEKAWVGDIIRTRHIGDFSNWKNNDSYIKAFERLMGDLKSFAS